VTKPREAPAGTVHIRKETILKVRPEVPQASALADGEARR
jgi:hypothetical protein